LETLLVRGLLYGNIALLHMHGFRSEACKLKPNRFSSVISSTWTIPSFFRS